MTKETYGRSWGRTLYSLYGKRITNISVGVHTEWKCLTSSSKIYAGVNVLQQHLHNKSMNSEL